MTVGVSNRQTHRSDAGSSGSGSLPTSSPAQIASTPRGTVTLNVMVAGSRGWSLDGNQRLADTGSPTITNSSPAV